MTFNRRTQSIIRTTTKNSCALEIYLSVTCPGYHPLLLTVGRCLCVSRANLTYTGAEHAAYEAVNSQCTPAVKCPLFTTALALALQA